MYMKLEKEIQWFHFIETHQKEALIDAFFVCWFINKVGRFGIIPDAFPENEETSSQYAAGTFIYQAYGKIIHIHLSILELA